MEIKKVILGALIAAGSMALSACGGSGMWGVKGHIDDAEGKTLVLEGSNQGRWYVIDSLTLDGKGEFAFTQSPTGYPDIYRLRIGERSIYFPIDSIETITVKADGADFGAEYTLAGSDQAVTMAELDHKIMETVNAKGAAAAVADTALRHALSDALLANSSSALAYYIINKKVGDTPLYNPSVKADLRVIGAVANAFATERPNDPRTKYLEKLYVSSRRNLSEARDTMLVAEVPIIDFALPDENGVNRAMSDLASKGKVVILNFTVYDADPSPAFNMRLTKLYNALRERGLEIVQVAVDDDHFAWSRSARNLPWTTLYAPENRRAQVLMSYNVTNLPTSFIINRKGEIVKRVDDVERLAKEVEAYL